MERRLEDYVKLPYTIILRPDDDGDWVAQVEELKGCTAHGSSQGEALERLEDAKLEWITSALAHSLPVPTPAPDEPLPSGKWIQRVPRSLHSNLRQLARTERTSLNHLVTRILSEYVGAMKIAGTHQWLQAGAFTWVAGVTVTTGPMMGGPFVVREKAANVSEWGILEAMR